MKRDQPRSAEELFSRSKAFQNRWSKITHIVTRMRRDKLSLQQASREFGLDPRSVRRLAGSALRKRRNGRYAATARDKLLRVVVVPGERGPVEIPTRDSRIASDLAKYSGAVDRYLSISDSSGLQEFVGRDVLDLKGERLALMTDPVQLDRFGETGLSYESFYARTA